MSNRRGDRYTCTDPNCGCEIEVKAPCGSGGTLRSGERNPDDAADLTGAAGDRDRAAMSSDRVGGGLAEDETKEGYAGVTDRFADHGHGVPSAGNISESGFRSESISTSSDFGKQGTTGEGIFGTVGGESTHVHTEGRYGSHLPRKKVSSGGNDSSFDMSAAEAPRCFCGSEMRESSAARVRSATA